MTQPVWHQGDNIGKFTVLPGIIDFKYQHSINVNTFFEYIPGTVRQVMLETATPLVHMIPLTEDDVEIRCHEVSTDEYNRMNHNITKFKGSYRDRKVQLNTNEPSKCPFKLWH
jgi:hypothetical protein